MSNTTSDPGPERGPQAPLGAGKVPVAVVMIALNEAHQMKGVLDNLRGWASEIFLVDSYSSDETVSLALEGGVHVVQRPFRGFGDQWNFALKQLAIRSPWTMKLDPDERISDALKRSIEEAIRADDADALEVERRLWFMGKALPIRQRLIRLWRTGSCRFSDVLVNEHPIVGGKVRRVAGELEHHDSPTLHHWFDKQNHYTTVEAYSAQQALPLSAQAKLWGSALERRMWIKKHFQSFPGRYLTLFAVHYFAQGAWRAGRRGLIWSRLRAEVYRMIELKQLEMRFAAQAYTAPERPRGTADPRVPQYP